MSGPGEIAALARRLERVENALADALARLPGLRHEVGEIRAAALAVELRCRPREALAAGGRDASADLEPIEQGEQVAPAPA